jgi:hypothetical protein
MRPFLFLLAAALLASPAWAQQPAMPGAAPAPMTAAPPSSTAPSATAPTTPAAASHGRHHRQTMQQRFDAANTTHDGKLTLEQAKAANMTRTVRNFDTIDVGHKGYVTLDDMHAAARAARAAHKPAP